MACATASFMPQSAPPVSRSVVKPRSSIARICTEPFAASKVSGTSDSSCSFTSDSTMWICASIRPGISVALPMSMRCAEADLIGRSETSLTKLPSTSTSMPSRSSSWRAVEKRPPVKRNEVIGVSAVVRAVAWHARLWHDECILEHRLECVLECP